MQWSKFQTFIPTIRRFFTFTARKTRGETILSQRMSYLWLKSTPQNNPFTGSALVKVVHTPIKTNLFLKKIKKKKI